MFQYMSNAKQVHITDKHGNILFSHMWWLGFTTLYADTSHGRGFQFTCKSSQGSWPTLRWGIVQEGWVETGLDNSEEWMNCFHPTLPNS